MEVAGDIIYRNITSVSSQPKTYYYGEIPLKDFDDARKKKLQKYTAVIVIII